MQKTILTLAIFAMITMSSIAIAQRPGGDDGARRGGDRAGQPRGGQRGPRGGMPVSPLMMALDVDKDGKLSAEEISNAPKVLNAMDKNKDGSLDASEMMPTRPERAGGRGDLGEGGRGGAGGRGAGGNVSTQVDRMMERDADKDGKISKEEGGDRMSRFFGMMDGDKDGFLTKEEITTAMQRFQGGGNRGGRGGRGGDYQAPPKSKDNRPPFEDQ